MLKTKFIVFVTLLTTITLTTSGCIKLKSGKTAGGVDGGVFKTLNGGATWAQKALIPTTGGNRSIASLDIASFAIDPNDHNALYFGSVGNGLFYSYDGGSSWQLASKIGPVTIRDVVVDPSSKCIIYASSGNKVFKSTDCSRSFTEIYFDTDKSVIVNTVAVDHFDSSVVYIGLSRGDVIKSFDAGESWRTVSRFKDKVLDLVIDPNDSRKVYAITNSKGFFRSEDSGINWTDMNSFLKEEKMGLAVKDLVLIKNRPELIYAATGLGIIRSEDIGETWQRLELIPPEKKASINAMAVNPKTPEEIYYTTNTTLYRSKDSGATWTPSKLPSTRAGYDLLIDPEEPNVIYMGVRSLKK